MALEEFHRFPHLPTELRLRIYELSLQYPRTVEIRTDDHPSNIDYFPSPHSPSSLYPKHSDLRWATHSPTPPLLSVSHEARSVALAHYTLAFPLLPSRQVIYLNPSLDIVLPRVEKWSELLDVLLEDIRSFDCVGEGRGVRRLALAARVWIEHYSPAWGKPPGRRVRAVERLDEIIVVGRMSSEEYWEGSWTCVEPETEEEVMWVKENRDVVMGCYKNAKTDGVDGPKLSMLAVRRE